MAADFLRRLIEAIPYRVRTVLTDNGTHFTDLDGETWSPAEIKQMIADRQPFLAHVFEYACALNDIDHRLANPKHPWTNGQVERMNRTIKDATVKCYSTSTSCGPICATSSTPTTSPERSRPSEASPL